MSIKFTSAVQKARPLRALRAAIILGCAPAFLFPMAAYGSPQLLAGPAWHSRPIISRPSPTGALVLADAVPYRDCKGATPIERTHVYRDTCLDGTYLLAHNPGPFTALLSLKIGSVVSYQHHLYTIHSIRQATPAAQWREAQAHPSALTLQTCTNDARGLVWVFTAG